MEFFKGLTTDFRSNKKRPAAKSVASRPNVSPTAFRSGLKASGPLSDLTPPFTPINITEHFFPRSTIPRDFLTVKSKWISGTKELIDYMNNQFIPFEKEHTNDTNPIIYMKRGTTGIAGQMRGACDALLLSMLNKREFKIYAPSLQTYLFAMPFFNITYPYKLKNDQGAIVRSD